MRPPPRLRLPPARPWPRIALLLSVAAHGLLLFGWIEGRVFQPLRRPVRLIVLSPLPEAPAAVSMRFHPPRGTRQPGTWQPGTPRERLQPRRARPPVARAPAVKTPPRAPAVIAAPPVEEPPSDTVVAAVPPRMAIGRIGPGIAAGKLWVKPLPLPPKELAERLTKTHVQLVDSAVTAIVQAFLDSIVQDPASQSAKLPSWTTDVAGKKFGLDGRNLYIAGLKIPAALLALLPLKTPGNIDQAHAYNHLQDLRADLQYAAMRAETADEFKKAIREIRARKEREREFQRNQRTAPPPPTPRTP